MPVDPISLIGGGLKLLGGLFGGDDPMTPSQSIMSTAKGARQAGQKYGFNPLSLLKASNATAGAGMSTGVPPLASLSILGDVVEETFGEEAQTRKEHNRLQNELLRLEVDRARSLGAVAVAPSVAGGGAITGRNVRVQFGGASRGFLDEADRNPARADERDNTVSYQSHGQETVVPVGPDADEFLSGVVIDAMNRSKAARERMSMGPMDTGAPLVAPWNGYFFNRFDEIMPPKYGGHGKPRANPRRRDLPLKSWEQTFNF